MYYHTAVSKRNQLCMYLCCFIVLIVLSCHLRLWLCAVDMNFTVLQINMCYCKSLYNILLMCLFFCVLAVSIF